MGAAGVVGFAGVVTTPGGGTLVPLGGPNFDFAGELESRFSVVGGGVANLGGRVSFIASGSRSWAAGNGGNGISKGPFIYYVSTFFHQPHNFHEFFEQFFVIFIC